MYELEDSYEAFFVDAIKAGNEGVFKEVFFLGQDFFWNVNRADIIGQIEQGRAAGESIKVVVNTFGSTKIYTSNYWVDQAIVRANRAANKKQSSGQSAYPVVTFRAFFSPISNTTYYYINYEE